MKPLFNRRQRYAIYKFWYLLSLVRWYNILAIVVAQFLISVYLLKLNQGKLEILLDPYLHLSIISTAFIIASGFIINSFYDLERDTINRPDKVIFSRLVSQTTCLNFYFLFNTIGVVLSFYVSKRVMLFNFLFSIALWFFSHKLQKKAFLGELSATLLTLTPLFVVVVYYAVFSFDIFLYLSFFFLIILIREIVKDILSEKGDLIFGYETLPIKVGIRGAKKTIGLLMGLTLLPFAVLFYLHGYSITTAYFLVGEILLLMSSYLLFKAQTEAEFKRLHQLLKFIIALGVLSIPLI